MNLFKKYPTEIIIAFIGAIIFSYISFRAFNLSITIDEVTSSELYQFSYFQIMFSERCFWSANNHVLNSILLKFFVSLFGFHDWVIRIPNVLSYLIYFGSSWWAIKNITTNRLLQIIGIIILNSDIYLIDFFSLCRGYGMANAFEMLSIAAFINVLKTNFSKGNSLLFISAALSVYSNFTWIPFYLAVGFVYCLMYAYKNKIIFNKLFTIKIINLLIISISLFLLCFKPISYLINTNEFKYGTKTLSKSFSIFVQNISYNGNESVGNVYKIAIVVLVILSMYISIFSIIKKKQNEQLYLILLLIFTILIGSILQRNILETMYPDGRKATMYLPLMYLLLFIILVFLEQYYPRVGSIISFAFSLFFIFHFIKFKNINAVREWWFDEHGKEVANYLANNSINNHNRTAVNGYMLGSIYFYNKYELNEKIEKIISLNDIKKEDSIEYFYVLNIELNKIPEGYKLLKSYNSDNNLYNLKK